MPVTLQNIMNTQNTFNNYDEERKDTGGAVGARPRKTLPALVHISLETQAEADRLVANNEKDEYGNRPLALAAYNSRLELCAALLQAGAEIDDDGGFKGCTPLLFASEKGHADIVKILLDHNANVDQPTNYGRTPLYIASQEGHVEVVRILKDHEINLLFTNLDKDHIRCKTNQDQIKATYIIRIFESIESKTYLHDSNFKTKLIKTVAILQLEVFGKLKWKEKLNETSLAIKFGELLREINKSIAELMKALHN